MQRKRVLAEPPGSSFWSEVDADDLLDTNVRRNARAKVRKKLQGQTACTWQAGLYDKETWELAHDKPTRSCTILHKSTGAAYTLPQARVNKALQGLDPESASKALIPTRSNCRCTNDCCRGWNISEVLALRQDLYKQANEAAATTFLASFIRSQKTKTIKRASYIVDSDCSVGDSSEEDNKARDLVELLQPRRKYVYELRRPGTNKTVPVCSYFFRAVLGVSADKLQTARNLAVLGPGARTAPRVRIGQPRVMYNRTRAFWWQLFDKFCQRPNNHTRLFPVNKPMQTIYDEYFKPWYKATYKSAMLSAPSYATFIRARNDEAFADVKRRPKHFHAQCGPCYRLRTAALRTFKNRSMEKKWLVRLHRHDKAIVDWRAHVAEVISDSSHNPHEHVALFFDDTGTVDLPHLTGRPLKDAPMGRLPIIPWLVQNVGMGDDFYFYMVKKSFKKGGNRLCSQLLHVLRSIKNGSGPAARAKKLTLIADNYNENKNNTLFAFLSHLVHAGWFDSIHLIFGEVGHTHNGDDAQHEIHNNKLSPYLSPTLAHWISRYPLAWRKEHSRPRAVLLHALYDFDSYYRDYLDELAGFTKTSRDDAYIRGFSFQRERNNWVTCRVSADPANGKPYLGIENTPESRGYLVLKRPPPASHQLLHVRHNKDIMAEKFKRAVVGPAMASNLDALGEPDAIEWLKEALDTAKVPVAAVFEKETPPDQIGRLVQIKCGDHSADVREIVPLFEEGKFDYQLFWKAPVRAAEANERRAEGPAEDSSEELLPNVGYRRVRPRDRPTYPGSAREAMDSGRITNGGATSSNNKQPSGGKKRRRPDREVSSSSEESEVESDDDILESIKEDSMVIYTADAEQGTKYLGQLTAVDDEKRMLEVHRYSLSKNKWVPLYEDPDDNKHIAAARPKTRYKPVLDHATLEEVHAKNFQLVNGALPRRVQAATDFNRTRQR